MSDATRPTAIRLTFVDEGSSARANLLWDKAPATCAAGPTPASETKAEATSKVAQGHVGFTWMAAGSSYSVSKDFAEICWFYDIDAQPRMWEGPVEVNIFAEIQEPSSDFYEVCRRMRREGVKVLQVEADSP